LRSFAVLRTARDDRFAGAVTIIGAESISAVWAGKNAHIARTHHDEVCDAFRVEMNFAAVFAGEAIEQFGESTLRAVLPVNKRSNDRKTQVRSSRTSMGQ
jgi:hypothetical protein